MEQVNSIRDLSILFNEKLTFAHSYEHCVRKALRVVKFIKRNTYEFKVIAVIRSIWRHTVSFIPKEITKIK